MDVTYWYTVFGISFVASILGVEIFIKDLENSTLYIEVAILLVFCIIMMLVSANIFMIKLLLLY
mgnify:FL=1|jgi:hypothetical protein